MLHALQDHSDPNSVGSRLRRARTRHIIELIDHAFAAKGQKIDLLDLGGEQNYWLLFDGAWLRTRVREITLVNIGPAEASDPLFVAVTADACALGDHRDGAFDVVHSNSVIEHVGDWARMEAFAREARRLAPAYFVQTPYVWFPVEPHFSAPFFHWRSEQARARMLMRRDYGFHRRAHDLNEAMRAVQSARLLDRAQMRALFPDAEIREERVLGLTKSLMAVRTAKRAH